MGHLDDSREFDFLKLFLLGNILKIPSPSQHTPTLPKRRPFILYVSLLAKKKQPGCLWLLLLLNYCGVEGLWTIAHEAAVRAGLCHYFRQVAGVAKVRGSPSNSEAELSC